MQNSVQTCVSVLPGSAEWQVFPDVEMNAAAYGEESANAEAILGGRVRPPAEFDALISDLIEDAK